MIINSCAVGGGTQKESTYTPTGSGYSSTNTLTFTVDGCPKQWALYACSSSSDFFVSESPYIISTAYSENGITAVCFALKRYNSYGQAQALDASSAISTTYSNGVVTLTASGNYAFMNNWEYTLIYA